ncbi:Aste57867_9688 [Aphanomyces stellatus]|uniref:Aste57867_9688 protein n=1 Tax=Aphanomyces stellatus TaxID=120398 RepID=A0A485KP41_9STRA|nr:hypothetical protein As57867_009650 [Aphanomyces stellatus]VFT86567.1 Aste57867_9688 [Aphanomyces stellatus]
MRRSFDDAKDLECPLCYETFRDPVQVSAPCHHHFCRECIDRWFRQQPICPWDRHVCSTYGAPAPELMAALEQVNFTCDDCLWEGKWVDHQPCPLVSCGWCPWKSYSDGTRHLVRSEAGYVALGQHLIDCIERQEAAHLEQWVNSDNGIRFGMSIDQVHRVICGRSLGFAWAYFQVAAEVTNFECRYFFYRLTSLRRLFPCLPDETLFEEGSYCCFLFEKDAGLRLVSLRFFERNADGDGMPRCLTYFTQLFNASLNNQRQAIVRHPTCIISMTHLRGSFHDEPGILQTFVEFVDPRNVPQNGLFYGISDGDRCED